MHSSMYNRIGGYGGAESVRGSLWEEACDEACYIALSSLLVCSWYSISLSLALGCFVSCAYVCISIVNHGGQPSPLGVCQMFALLQT